MNLDDATIAELQRKAKLSQGRCGYGEHCGGCRQCSQHEDFQDAANPATISALCDEVRRLREDMNAKYWDKVRADNIRLEAENAKLRESLVTNAEKTTKAIDEFVAEIAKLRAVEEAAKGACWRDHATDMCGQHCCNDSALQQALVALDAKEK